MSVPLLFGVFVAALLHLLNLRSPPSARWCRRCGCTAPSSSAAFTRAAAPLPAVRESGLIAIGLAALAAGLAQARIGSGAVGAIAEKPELAGRSILLVAIPETLVILASPSRP